MEIRKAEEDTEYYQIGGGYEICCPICGAMWLQETEGDFTHETCEHLRFILHSNNSPYEFEFINDWNTDEFIEKVNESCPEDEDADWDILDVLTRIHHRDVDKILFYHWHEDPMYQPWTIWGYKSNDEAEIDLQDIGAWISKGKAHFNSCNYDDALKAYDKALNLNPKLVEVWVTKSAILGTIGKYAECIQACDKAIELDPKNEFAWGNKGEALKDLGKYEEAIQALDTAIELDPNDSDAWHNRGIALKSLGRDAEADAAFTKVRELRCFGDAFARRFSHWNIVLPQEDINARRSGYISQAGWLIQYCFGKDDTSEYLDYYAAHRMTNDRHERIYSDGREESLPALNSWCLTSDDPTRAKQLRDEYDRHNQEVVKMLTEKGFDRFTINMYLHAS